MKYPAKLMLILCVAMMSSWPMQEAASRGRGGLGGGFRGGGGGGGFHGGGRGGGFHGASRPSINRSPSMSRPSRPQSRPSRPGNFSRPSTRPGAGSRPGGGLRPGGDRPGIRPGIGTRPGSGKRPGIGERPTQLPGLGLRPGAAALPAAAALPGLADRSGWGNRGEGIGRSHGPIENRQERANNLKDRMSNRDDFRGDRQDRWGDRREDWQNWHDDHYHHHADWYHGAWSAGARWGYMWDNYPVAAAFGLTAWGVNRMSYLFGYSDYYNPYYSAPAESSSVIYDYSQPIAEAPASDESSTQGGIAGSAPPAGMDAFDLAKAAFYDGDYSEAMRQINRSLEKLPNDAVVHEFRSLILFALGQYQESAAVINTVLAVSPGWDWTTMSSLYPSVAVYTNQLRALESYAGQHQNDAAPFFLLAYHYQTAGHNKAAVEQLERVLKLQPRDAVAAQLYKMLTSSGDSSSATKPPTAAEPNKGGAAISEDQLTGIWAAKKDAAESFKLELGQDDSFVWTYTERGQSQSVKGTWAVDGNTLAMEPDQGGVMLANLTMKGDDEMHFQMFSADQSDPGLDFKKLN